MLLIGGASAFGVIVIALFLFGRPNNIEVNQANNISGINKKTAEITTGQHDLRQLVNPSRSNTSTEPRELAADALDQIGVPITDLQRADLRDMFDEMRGGTRRHEAVDIMAPRGTPIVAVTDGVVKKLFTSEAGGLTIYQYDTSETYSYYYAHLDRYAEDLQEGQLLKKGQLVGYVGSTGNANPTAPHLHFAIFKLGPEKRWWEGTPINPYPYLLKALDRKNK